MRSILLCLIFISISLASTAQRSCGTDHYHAHKLLTDPAYAKRFDKAMSMKKITAKQRALLSCSGTTVIPVAIHYNDPVNCDDWECLLGAAEAQIEVLNEDFSATNDDLEEYYDWNDACPASYPLSTAPEEGEGTCLQFCLASKNHPDGSGLSDGDPAITVGEFTFNSGADVWDGYLNIFVSQEFGFLGLSPLPGSADGDGFWVTNTSFGGPGFSCFSGGNINTSNTYDLGRTATHEAGHYFGLPHVFGNCSDSDSNPPGPININDTPGQNNPFFGDPFIGDCGDVITQCGGNVVSFFSFMDYSDDAGMVMFTADQSEVIDWWGNDIDFVNDATVCDDDYGAPECAGLSIPLALELSDSEDVLCNGENDGFIEVEAIGGDGDYTFTIEPGGQSNDDGIFEDLAAGDYVITVEDGSGESIEIEVTIEEPDPLLVELIESIDLTCFDSEDGIIEIDITGGTEDYNVSLNGDNMGDDEYFDGLVADVYEVEVEDDNDCVTIIEVTVNAPAELLLELVDSADPSCAGYEDGMIELMATGGTVMMGSNYTYSLDGINFQPTGNFNTVGAGNYNVIVQDDNGCQTMVPVDVFDPDPIIITVEDSQESISCFGDEDAFLEISGSNTDGPYTYSIDGLNYVDSGLFENLGAGAITLYTQDDNGCVETLELTIESPDLLEIEANITAEISCFQEDDGEVSLNSLGGTSDYNYYLGDFNTPVGEIVENLGPGSYDFLVEDANGCTAMINLSLEEPEEIILDVLSIQEVECFGDDDGEAQLTASGGAGGFLYMLDGDSNLDGIFTNLTSGTYVATVEDANGCNDELVFDITQTSNLLLDVMVTEENNCAGETNGSFTLSGDGGTGNYQYSIDGVNFTDQATYDNLPGGIYDVFVIDDNDCITASSATIEEPEVINLESMEISSIQCNGDETGVISIAATGGSEGFSYTLGSETNMTGIFMDLPAGSMMIEVTDQNGCSESIEVTLDQPEAIASSSSSTNNSCEGMMIGTASANASGGTGMLSYSLDNMTNDTGLFENLAAGSYDIVITDENNCSVVETVFIANDINLQLSLVDSASPTCNDTEDGMIEVAADGGNGNYTYTLGMDSNNDGVFGNLSAGDYVVIVNDPQGCQTELEVSIEATPLIDISNAQINDAECFGEASGTVDLNADGGTGNLSFTLNEETNSTGIFENLEAGEYELVVMDENGCETNSMIIIEEPAELSLTDVIQQNIECFGDASGLLSFSGLGGTGNLNFSLDGNDNPTGEFSDLAAGFYEIAVTDENNCVASEMIQIQQPDEIIADMQDIQHVDCFGSDNGGISISANVGTGALSYSLDGQESTEGTFINLTAGAYTAIITDDLGCSSTLDFDIDQPQDINISPIVVDAMGDNLGSIQLDIQGGDGNYTVVLNGTEVADPGLNFDNLDAGIYTVDVTDANGCNKEIEVEVRLIDIYDGLPYGITINEVLCPNPATDLLTIKYESTIDQTIIFSIYNDLGKYIGRYTDDVLAGPNTYVFDVTDFAQGAYFLQVIAERQDKYFQFIKMDD